MKAEQSAEDQYNELTTEGQKLLFMMKAIERAAIVVRWQRRVSPHNS